LCNDVGPSPAIISSLYNNGNVNQYLARNPQADRKAIVLDVARGLEYLHAQNIIHGFLKPRNVLLDDHSTAHLCDIGRAKLIEHRGYDTVSAAGSARQLAPEFVPIMQLNEPPELSKEADIYAFSMVALETLSGKLPFFYVRTDFAAWIRVQRGERPMRSRYLPTIFTDGMWELLVDCWDQDPYKRPDMGAVVRRLEAM